MKKIHNLFILSITSIWLLSGYQVSAFSTLEQSKWSPKNLELPSHKISQNNQIRNSQTPNNPIQNTPIPDNQNNSRDTSTLEKALIGRWVSEPLVAGKNSRLTYYFSPPNIWLTGQEIDGKQVSGEQLRYKIIKVNEKENSLRIRYGLLGSPESLDAEATVLFTQDRQSLVAIFHANGLDVPSLKPFRYAGSQLQP